MKSFVEKYQPIRAEEIPQPVRVLQAFIVKKEPVLLYGPTGSGKTTAVYSIARECGYDVIEFNASDVRNKAQVESVMQSALTQSSLFLRPKIILIDEIDGLSGTEDRGGGTALARLLDDVYYPVVMTANDPNNDKLKDIRKKATLLEFPAVKISEVVKILQRVCNAEGLHAAEDDLKKIALNANGDIRAAVNDLQANCRDKRVVVEGAAAREYETDVAHALNIIFKTRGLECSRVFEHMNVDLDAFMLWLDENLPAEYTNVDDLARAYEKVALADIFHGRIRRWQYWRFLVYRSLLLSVGVSLAKEQPYKTLTKYKRTMRLLKIWQANMRNAKKKTIAEKLAKYTHSSVREVVRNFSWYKQIIVNNNCMNELRLDSEEMLYLES